MALPSRLLPFSPISTAAFKVCRSSHRRESRNPPQHIRDSQPLSRGRSETSLSADSSAGAGRNRCTAQAANPPPVANRTHARRPVGNAQICDGYCDMETWDRIRKLQWALHLQIKGVVDVSESIFDSSASKEFSAMMNAYVQKIPFFNWENIETVNFPIFDKEKWYMVAITLKPKKISMIDYEYDDT